MAKRNEPSQKIKKIVQNLSELGKTIVAIRGNGFSGNLIGTISLSEDGGETVFKIKDCKCHVHVMWDKIKDITIDEEDVGYGPEPVVRFVDSEKKPIVHLFYPRLSREDLEKAVSV